MPSSRLTASRLGALHEDVRVVGAPLEGRAERGPRLARRGRSARAEAKRGGSVAHAACAGPPRGGRAPGQLAESGASAADVDRAGAPPRGRRRRPRPRGRPRSRRARRRGRAARGGVEDRALGLRRADVGREHHDVEAGPARPSAAEQRAQALVEVRDARRPEAAGGSAIEALARAGAEPPRPRALRVVVEQALEEALEGARQRGAVGAAERVAHAPRHQARSSSAARASGSPGAAVRRRRGEHAREGVLEPRGRDARAGRAREPRVGLADRLAQREQRARPRRRAPRGGAAPRLIARGRGPSRAPSSSGS